MQLCSFIHVVEGAKFYKKKKNVVGNVTKNEQEHTQQAEGEDVSFS